METANSAFDVHIEALEASTSSHGGAAHPNRAVAHTGPAAVAMPGMHRLFGARSANLYDLVIVAYTALILGMLAAIISLSGH